MGLRTWLYQHMGIRLKRFEDPKVAALEAKVAALQAWRDAQPAPFDFDAYCEKNNIRIDRNVKIYPNVALKNDISIGSFSYIVSGSFIEQFTSIGRYCSIANHVMIGVAAHPLWLSTHPFQYHKNASYPYEADNKKTIIGNDVWVGVNAVILQGVVIGDGAIIGAGAVVTKDVAPYAIVGGVPAKLIRYRFDEPTTDALLELKWWELSMAELWKNRIDYANPLNAIDEIRKIKRNSNKQ